MDARATLELFDEVAAAARQAALDTVSTTARDAPGGRSGQYELDLSADEVVVAALRAAGFAVMSEETGTHDPDRAVTVVVDPVDGSTNASRGLPGWATSLCAVDEHGPWVSTVVDHSRRVTYRAVRGGGATRQGVEDAAPVRIAVAPEVDLGDAVVAINGWPAEPLACRQFRALGAAAIEWCLVAEGALDGYLGAEADAHGPWDYLGAWLVLDEAGGVAADCEGRDLVSTDHAARRTIAAASGQRLLDQLGSSR